MGTVVVIIAGCLSCALFSWFACMAYEKERRERERKRAYAAGLAVGSHSGYRQGYDAGYAAPVRSTLTGNT